MEESMFKLRYVKLFDVGIPTEKWLNYLQTVETLIKRSMFASYPFRNLQFSMGLSQWLNFIYNFLFDV